MKRPADFKAKPRMNWGTSPRLLDYARKLISHYDSLVQYAIERRDAWRACEGCGPTEILDEARKSRDRATAFAIDINKSVVAISHEPFRYDNPDLLAHASTSNPAAFIAIGSRSDRSNVTVVLSTSSNRNTGIPSKVPSGAMVMPSVKS